VSLFRRETLHLSIGPEGAALVRLAGRRRPGVSADTRLAFAVDPHAPDLSPLANCLSAGTFKADAVHIVLDDSLARYFVVPRPAGLRNRAELEGLLVSRFEEQYGLASGAWAIRGELAPQAAIDLACAVPRRLIDALQSLCAELRMPLRSLRPYAISEIDRWQRKAPRGPAWFAAGSPDGVTLGYWSAAGWQGMRCHPVDGDWLPALPSLQARDGLMHGVPEGAPLLCTGSIGQSLSAPAAPHFQVLGAGLWPGRNASWSRGYRVALSGVWP